jgi:sulfoxide reductase heme-binding subunit YedZ
MIDVRSIAGVVRNPAGRLSPFKIAVLVLAVLPGILTAVDWINRDLGARPVTEAIHQTGLWAIRFLIITLAVTPARGVLDFPKIVMLRRMLGVTSACYATAHFALFIVDQNYNLFKVMTEILSRFYLAIGYVAFLGLLALAITSTDDWQRSLGRDWKKLHKLIFVIAPLVLFHYAVQSKADVSDAVFLTGLFVWLMFWRAVPRRLQSRIWPLPAFAVGAGLLAALMEAAWYMVRNHVNGLQVLDANLDIAYGPRPAVAVVLVGVAVLLAAGARKLMKKRRIPSGMVSTQG